MNWENTCYLGSALQAFYDMLNKHEDNNSPYEHNIQTKIPLETFNQIIQHISGEKTQTNQILCDIIKDTVKAYNFTPGNMECAAEALIKILDDWSPSNKPTTYLYETKSHITMNTCNHINNTVTETLVQLYDQNYNNISDAIHQLQTPVQIDDYTCATCQKKGTATQTKSFTWGQKYIIIRYTCTNQQNNRWVPTEIKDNENINLNNTNGDPIRYTIHSEICYADQHYVYKNHDQNLYINCDQTHINANKNTLTKYKPYIAIYKQQ